MSKINVDVDECVAQEMDCAAKSEGVSVETLASVLLCSWVTHTAGVKKVAQSVDRKREPKVA